VIEGVQYFELWLVFQIDHLTHFFEYDQQY